MESKAIATVITDTHLSVKNENEVYDIFRNAIRETKKLGLSKIFHAGDFFDNRKHQRLSTLIMASTIFKMFESEDVTLFIIPGNHDKANYSSEESYLDIFDKYENVFIITKDDSIKIAGDVFIHMVPFFEEKEIYPKYLTKCIDSISNHDRNILITHVAINGVSNNDGRPQEDVVTQKSVVDNFDLTLVGHFHNYCELADGKIVYIGGSHQHNFGEDDKKGLTLIHEDLSLSQISLGAKKYITHKIDLNVATKEEVESIVKENSNSEDNIRIKFTGDKEKLKGVDRKKLNDLGIDVKQEACEEEVDLDYIGITDFKGFNKSSIVDEWDEFSSKKELDEDVSTLGKGRLIRTLNL